MTKKERPANRPAGRLLFMEMIEMETYCIYLRKSRADAEAEARGEGETLARHEKTLLDLAKRQGLTIVKIYREIVSGDSIAARPQMQHLLHDIADSKYTGVLVMEIERLARGDTIDQGIVAQAFRESETKIVTPVKTYDPNSEFDEEYLEFSLFMSRREYKTIKRRMNAGRIASVKEGNYIGTNPPYGYRKISPEPKVHTLDIVPEEAEAVKMMFEMYINGDGARAIAARLNQLQIPPRKSNAWEPVSVRKILHSPIYSGKVEWRTKKDGIILADGLHPAIITPEQFQQATERHKRTAPQVPTGYTTQNYYHGILFCANCGHQMKRRPTPNGSAHMLCRRNECRGKVVSSAVEKIDEVVLAAIRYRMQEIALQKDAMELEEAQKNETAKKKREKLKKALEKLHRQKEKLHTLLETDVYTVETFLDRSKALESQIAELEAELNTIQQEDEAPHLPPGQALVQMQHVLDSFREADPERKNQMLCKIIRRIEYKKTEKMCYRKQKSDLSLCIDFL